MSLTVILRDFLWSLVIFCRQAKKIATSHHIIYTIQHTQIQHTYIPCWKRQILFVRLNDFCNKCATKLLSSITSIVCHSMTTLSKLNVDFLTKNFIWTNHIFFYLKLFDLESSEIILIFYIKNQFESSDFLLVLLDHLWQYRLWSFRKVFGSKSTVVKRKLLNFENWSSGELGIILENKVI